MDTATTTRLMEITTPLGKDLLFHRMNAREELGRLSEFEIDLLSPRNDIKFADILSKNVTVKLELANKSDRYFNGFVTRFAQIGMRGRYHLYHASVRPWLWFLTRTSDCRIFQKIKVPDILKQVFNDHKIADTKFELTGTYREWEYCVQYRETDFNFVSRLMEQEGIYYYFKHVDGRHTMVLTDSYSGHSPFPGHEQISFIPRDRARPEQEGISDWTFSNEVQAGQYAIDDYNFKAPRAARLSKHKNVRQHELADYELYDYPGEFTVAGEGREYVRARLEEVQAQFELAQGTTNCRGLCTGSLFKFRGHPRADQGREYLIVGATHDLEYSEYESMEGGGSNYACTIKVMNSREPFRTQRLTPKPIVQGPQTAMVVGPSGDEIYTDEFSRVKVQFHWDRYGKHDENSSCWIRVSSAWAGKAWGQVSIPRIGQEVIVDFLEGDPDQPIITGRVYNADQMPPYDLPADKTQSGLKSRSSLGGGTANFNEIRFEDKKGSEQLFIHAEKNQDIEVENDETHWVGHDRKKTIDHDETTLVKHDRTETVGNNETITIGVNRTEQVGSNETITIGSNRTITVGASETATVALQRTHTVGVNETITVGAAQEITIGAAQMLTVGAMQLVNIGANQTESIGNNESRSVGDSRSTDVGKDDSLKVGDNRSTDIGKDDSLNVGKNLAITAGDSITIKTGDASISMKKDGTIVIKGKDITIDGSGKINVKASSDIVMKGSKILQN